MCLPHYHSTSIFQVINKIEHAVNTTITEYYGQADKNKFTEAVDKVQQEVRESLDKVSGREKSKNYSSLRKMLFQSVTQVARNSKSEYLQREMNLWPSGYLSGCCTSWATRDLWEQNMLHTLRTGCNYAITSLHDNTPSVSWGPADTGGEREPYPLTCFSWELRSSLHHIASKRLLWKNYNLDKLKMRAAETWKTNGSLKRGFTNYLNLSISEKKKTLNLLPSE